MSRAAAELVEQATVIDVTSDGKGVLDVDGKRVFVHGAMTDETILFQRRKRRRKYDEGILLRSQKSRLTGLTRFVIILSFVGAARCNICKPVRKSNSSRRC